MPRLKVNVVRLVDETFPSFVECILVDSHGKSHAFVEKAPVVGVANLKSHPSVGQLRCTVLETFTDVDNRVLVHVSTERPDGVESTTGQREFVVLSSQLLL